MNSILRIPHCALPLFLLASSSCFQPPAAGRLPPAAQASRLPPADSNSDKVFLVLMFSGGGTRASALSFGVIEQLAQDSICVDGHAKSVADEIDIISAVSGGSFTAAYFALRGTDGFADFQRHFLYKAAQTELTLRSLMPEKLLPLLANPRYGRSHVAEELWDDLLFERRTLGDLARRGRPFVYINATEIDDGSVFSFTGDQLRALCIDADTFPIARAIAASSAVPGALSPVTLRNRCANVPRNRRYVHLLDGGLADNSGARVALRLLTVSADKGSIRDRIRDGRIATLLFVIVDARPGPTEFGKSAELPSVAKALYKSADIPINSSSSDAIRQLREQVKPENVAEVAFRNVADSATRAKLEWLGTSFQLHGEYVDLLRATGSALIHQEVSYRALLENYSIQKCQR